MSLVGSPFASGIGDHAIAPGGIADHEIVFGGIARRVEATAALFEKIRTDQPAVTHRRKDNLGPVMTRFDFVAHR